MRINKFVVAFVVIAAVTLAGVSVARNSTDKASAQAQQTVLRSTNGAWQASFTKGARTVTMAGPSRDFAEPSNTTATVTSTTWVRVYPQAFNGTVDQDWLKRAQADNERKVPDIIAIAMQYIANAPDVTATNGTKVAGDASYGPLLSNGKRGEGADFNDYLGFDQTYDSTVDKAEKSQLGDLDCSGFQRMVWGYRSGMPLSLQPNDNAIPRRSYQIFEAGPGVITIPDRGSQVTNLASLQVGDLVFHDASTDDGTKIDHVGIYIGVDSTGNHRFISSRKTADGPTFGDTGGKSILEGKGIYATSFRASRRL